jgi:hypothetical protein
MPEKPRTFAIVLPDGTRHDKLTRRQALDCLALMPGGSKIDPPLPPGNDLALTLLDYLCDRSPENEG